MADVLARVTAVCGQNALIPAGARVVVGVSGGADSLVLLHVLLRLRDSLGFDVHAATLDHGLRGPDGAADAAFVRDIAAEWGVPVTVGRADVAAVARDHGLNTEDAARRVRYAFLARVAQHVGADRIAVGHQRDDQAETVLLHLLRGAGLDGLRGMLPAATLNLFPADVALGQAVVISAERDRAVRELPLPLTVIRPLLDVPRADIDAYAAAHALQPRLDATNLNTIYQRNRLRHEVIPLLETINPQVQAALARLADAVRVDTERLALAGEAAFAGALVESRPNALVFDRKAWNALHLADKRRVILLAAAQLQDTPRDVTFTHIEAAIRVADAGQVGARAHLPGGIVLRVDYEMIALTVGGAAAREVDAPALDAEDALAFRAGDHARYTCGGWTFETRPVQPADDHAALHADPLAALLAIPAGAALALRRRVPGDRFAPRGMDGRSQKLKDTLIAMRVPAAWRDRVPLLVVEGAVAWFVAPSSDGLRGRVSDYVAVPDVPDASRALVVVRWCRAK